MHDAGRMGEREMMGRRVAALAVLLGGAALVGASCAGGTGERPPRPVRARAVTDGGARDASLASHSPRRAAALDAGQDAAVRVVGRCDLSFTSSGVAIMMAVPLTGPQLSESTLRLCAGQRCFDAPLPRIGRHAERECGPWSAAKRVGDISVRTDVVAFAPHRLSVKIWIDVTTASELKFDGTRYAVKMVDPRGRVLLDAQRRLVYFHPQDPCHPAVGAVMFLGKRSRSGIECTGLGCPYSTGFEVRLPLRDTLASLDDAKLTLCRNRFCVSDRLRQVGELRGHPYASGGMDGYVDGGWTLFNDDHHLALWVGDSSPLFAYAPGDRYRIYLETRGQPRRLLFDRRVKYETTYPNSKQCDAQPCRHARYDLCKPGECPGRSAFGSVKTGSSTPPPGKDAGLSDASSTTRTDKEVLP